MPVSALSNTNLALSSFFNYYGAPGANRSLYTAISTTTAVTYPSDGTSNLNMGTYATAGSFLFYLKANNTNGTKGTVSITYPWSQSTSVTNGEVGISKQVWTSVYTYITVAVSINYGYSFKGWYTASTGGTLISTATSVNVAFNSTYRDNIWYAQYN